jgi:catechol 2,3-dioxygenase-like lactoylglutathione lyase family enzyme
MARVNEIRYVAYGVSDFSAECSFYGGAWGLRDAGHRDGMAYFAAHGHDEPYVVRLRPCDENRIDVIALAAANKADVEMLHANVAACGGHIIFSPRELSGPGGGYGFRFFSPEGLPFEISSDVARGPRRDVQRWEGVPQRISHVVLHSPDPQGMVRFLTEALGFRISDWLGEFMCFLRCNSAHHRLAILPGPACLNHVAYDVPTVDDMMRGVHRLKQNDIPIKWGPGRHKAGNNTFSYFTTPNGFGIEYTSELEEVDDDHHQHTVHAPGPQIMDQWGVGVGGPHAMPHPEADKGLFRAAEV